MKRPAHPGLFCFYTLCITPAGSIPSLLQPHFPLMPALHQLFIKNSHTAPKTTKFAT